MPFIKSAQGSLADPVQLYYEDTQQGQPVVFIHGWPSSHSMWEYQINELPKYGVRCIAYDRRGFGKSDKPGSRYDYDELATDLNAVLEKLNLHDVVLVGFSMGGGEVVRYISKYGEERISKIVLVSSVTPYLLKTNDNPNGLPKEIFDDMISQIKDDRPGFLTNFGKQFFGVNMINKPVSQALLDWALMLELQASPRATIECVRSFSETDFRDDLRNITVPTLIIHGDSDKIVPIEISGKQAATMIARAKFKIYNGAPHGLYITEKEILNQDLVDFIVNPTMSDKNYRDTGSADIVAARTFPI